MRRLLLILLISLGALFLISQFTELQQVVNTMQRGDPRWLGLAIVVHLLWILNVAGSFKSIYRLLGVDEQILHLALVAAAAQFVSVVAPSGGMGGVAVLLADGRKRASEVARLAWGAAVGFEAGGGAAATFPPALSSCGFACSSLARSERRN